MVAFRLAFQNGWLYPHVQVPPYTCVRQYMTTSVSMFEYFKPQVLWYDIQYFHLHSYNSFESPFC